MRVSYEEMIQEFTRILEKKGFSQEDAEKSAKLFADNSLDGVYSHGINRFPRVVSYIEKGYIKPEEKPEVLLQLGAVEQWDGKLAMGNLNAQKAMDRAIELSKQFGIGMVAIRNTNHWMRGGSYGWQAAEAGCIGICWTNTMPNMPAWGGKEAKIGNNPFVLSVPRENGEHVVVDCAMAQFSYGKIESYKLQGKNLPLPGGYDTKGELTTDPAEIEKSLRVLPIGYWKGSSLAMGLDLMATVLSGGWSTTAVGKNAEDEYGLSQVLMAIDVNQLKVDKEQLIEEVLEDVKSSSRAVETQAVRYPGEGTMKTRKDNTEHGIPVNETIWQAICDM